MGTDTSLQNIFADTNVPSQEICFFLKRYFSSLSSLYRGLLAQISTSSGNNFLKIMANCSLNGYNDFILPK